jgi:purine-binding chemotaxis protein CheW
LEHAAQPDRRAGRLPTLACFEVHGRAYALDVERVREITRSLEVAPLPKAPALIEGMIELRGTAVPIVDLGRALGGDPIPPTKQARIVIVETDGLVLGLRVAAATDVLSVPAESLEAPPALATRSGYDAVQCVIHRRDAPPILWLSLDHLLESVRGSASAEGAR